MPPVTDRNVLVGTETSDDAAVYRLRDDLALIQTVDFFTPLLDDPAAFGAVAAANALSDVYAMGGRPIFALNIVAFPARTLPLEVLARIVGGGAAKAAEAGVPIVGGHSIDDPEPKYGLAVTGVVDPAKVVRNVGARPGDRLFLTKPLGTGILATAHKKGTLSPDGVRRITEVMSALNRGASEAMMRVGVRAATDVTGYGLLGHLSEMLQEPGLGARIAWEAVPWIEGVRGQAEAGCIPGGTRRNLFERGRRVEFSARLDELDRLLLADAQTSGGLLIAVAPDRAASLERELAGAGCPAVAALGEFVEDPRGFITVTA